MNRDFRDLIVELNAQGAEYLVVGAHALAAHGIVRATKDLDIWVNASAQNAAKVHRALAAFGAPLDDLTTQDLEQPGLIFQIGVAPLRIDVITSIDGVDFEDAWPSRLQTTFGGQATSVLSKEHLVQNKRASARLQDLADIERLEELDS